MVGRGAVPVFALCLALAAPAVADRKFTLINNCNNTIWPVIWTETIVSTGPSQGWEAGPKTSVAIQVPSPWTGRVWARQECQTLSNGTFTCANGGCGSLNCTTNSADPVTLLEWTLGSTTGDFYDISIVDGYNLPVEIKSNTACPTISCPANFTATCPKELQGPTGANGTLSCISSCRANIGDSTQHAKNCCTGDFNTIGTCNGTDVQYYNWFHSGCPDAYAYAYDDQSGAQSSSRCPGVTDADYTVTFCPEGLVNIAAPANDFASASTFTSGLPPQTSSTSFTSLTSTIGIVSSSSASSTTFASASPSASSYSTHSGLSSGAIGGIVAGVLGWLVLLGLGVFLIRRRRQRNLSPPLMQEHVKPYGTDDVPATLPQMGYATPSVTSPQEPPPSAVSGKRALMMRDRESRSQAMPSTPLGSRQEDGSGSSTSGTAVAHPDVISPSSGSAPRPQAEAEFEERFQARLMQFLQEHMDPPDARSDAALPRYPG